MTTLDSVLDATPDQLIAAIGAALRAQDMPAVAALLHLLAVKDPTSAEVLLIAIEAAGYARRDGSVLSSIGGGEAATDMGSSRGTVPDGISSLAGRRHLRRSTSGELGDNS